MLFRGKFFVGGRVPPLVVEFSERAGGDVDVLRKPLILNPAGTEGQILINALALRNVRVVGKPYLGITSRLPVTRAQSQEAITIKVASTCFEFRGSTGLHGVFSSSRWAQKCSPSGFSIRYWVSWPGVHWAATTTPSP